MTEISNPPILPITIIRSDGGQEQERSRFVLESKTLSASYEHIMYVSCTLYAQFMLSPFLTQVMEPQKGAISPRRLSDVLHISLAHLSKLTQLHRNTLTRHPESPEVQQRLGEVARIISIAADLVGDQQRAIIWFRHQPLSGFDNKTAEELVAAGHTNAVLEHLAMLSDGVYA